MNKTYIKAFHARRILAAGLALFTALSAALPAGAAELTPARDETFYATLDCYGDLLDSSVVKSVRTFGAPSITDYGSYDAVLNLTDSREAEVSGDQIRFDLTGDVPEKFYFEGKTAQPYAQFPWELSLSYTLNGLPARAEELAGEKGVVEITLHALPRSDAPAYSRNNLVLTAVSMFNGDDILSLEAPGAQVQLFGNLYCVLFAVLPGEEQHWTIRVGTEGFTYSGMVLLAVPATLQQLDQVTELREAKEEAEDSYHAMLDSMHAILDSMEGMSGDLNAAASGLDQLNRARSTVSAGKNQVYDQTDAALDAAAALAQSLNALAVLPPQEEAPGEDGTGEEPLPPPAPAGHLATAKQALSETNALFNEMSENLTSLRPEVEELRRILTSAQGDLTRLRTYSDRLHRLSGDLSGDLEELTGSMEVLEYALRHTSGISSVPSITVGGMSVEELREAAKQAQAAHSQYLSMADQLGGMDFHTFLVQVGQKSESEATRIVQLYNLSASGKLDEQLEQADTANGMIGSVNNKITEINGMVDDLAKPAGRVLSDLADVLNELDSLNGILSDLTGGKDLSALQNGQDAAEQALRLSEHLDAALDQLEALTGILNTYDPQLQQALTDAQTTVLAATASLEGLTGAARSAETLLRQSGGDLDQGTKRTLSGVSASLRKATGGLEQTRTVREALDTVDALLSSQWDSHTGQDNNVLLMDAGAAPVSLTDSRNQGTASIQYIMRTQEIVEQEAEEPPLETAQRDPGTFWSRVAGMFRDIWRTITGLFS